MPRSRSGAQLFFVGVTLGAVALLVGCQGRDTGSRDSRREPDSVWYRTSDVALLARTGRPQLVEFFHPG